MFDGVINNVKEVVSIIKFDFKMKYLVPLGMAPLLATMLLDYGFG